MATVVHVSPHPDDEALGAPATLLLLRRAGWTVVHALVSLGRDAAQARRRAEAVDAARRGRFELVLPESPFAISTHDDLDVVQPRITRWLEHLLHERGPTVVMSPSPHDAHPGHEVVARATADAAAAMAAPPRWWTWGLWADLPSPTVYVPFDDDVLTEAQHVLSAYEGELRRNDYHRLLTARASAHAVLGSERVFGFGSARASTMPYAELLTELRRADDEWHPEPARMFDPRDPLPAR